jgi:NADPH:quinone reductase-like Zn-dependent oxidoreductase
VLARDIGADHAINYAQTADVAGAASALTGGRGVDAVVDAVGAATWPLDFAAVRTGGRIALCGVTTGAQAEIDLRALYWNQLSIFGSRLGSTAEFRAMLETMDRHGVRPVIDAVYPLEDAREATARMEAGEQFGKTVLAVGGPERASANRRDGVGAEG